MQGGKDGCLNSRLLGPVKPDQGRSSPLRPDLKNTRWAFLDLRKLWYHVQSPSLNSAASQRKCGILACSIQFPGRGWGRTQIRTRAAPFQGRVLLPVSSQSPLSSHPHDLAMKRNKSSFFLGFSFLEFGAPSGCGGSKVRIPGNCFSSAGFCLSICFPKAKKGTQ